MLSLAPGIAKASQPHYESYEADDDEYDLPPEDTRTILLLYFKQAEVGVASPGAVVIEVLI